MIDFIILSRFSISTVNPGVNHFIISITEPENEYPTLNINNNCLNWIRLCYTDEDKPDEAEFFGRSKYMFSATQADAMLESIFRFKDQIDLIICQCDGGISRSSGTAAALSVILNGNKTDDWIFNSRKYIPNMFVYRKILNRYIEKFMEENNV